MLFVLKVPDDLGSSMAIDIFLLCIKSCHDLSIIVPLKILNSLVSSCNFLSNDGIHLSLSVSLELVHLFLGSQYCLVERIGELGFDFSKLSFLDSNLRIKFSTYASHKLFECFAFIFDCFLKLCNEFLDLFVVLVVVTVVTKRMAILIFLLFLGLCVFEDFDLFALQMLDLFLNLLSGLLDSLNSGMFLSFNLVKDRPQHGD